MQVFSFQYSVFSGRLLWENRGVKRCPRIVLISLACGVAFVSTLHSAQDVDPVYHGKSLAQWLDAANGSARGTLENEAARLAIQEIGTNGLPYLVKALANGHSVSRDTPIPMGESNAKDDPAKVTIVLRQGLTAADARAASAAYGFYVLGPAASPAVPALASLLNQSNKIVSTRAMEALVEIGKEGIPPLIAVLKDEQHANRGFASFCIRKMCMRPSTRTNMAVELPVVMRCLKDKDKSVVAPAAAALGLLRLEPGICVPALADLLKHTDWSVRQNAADSLRRFGEDARPALPALLSALHDPARLVRMEATNTIRNIAPEVLEKLARR